jgi:hypothetical protein
MGDCSLLPLAKENSEPDSACFFSSARRVKQESDRKVVEGESGIVPLGK